MEPQYPEYSGDQQDSRKKVLYIVIGLLVLTNLVLIFLFYQNNEESKSELQSSRQELKETYNKLESISNELDLKIEEIQKLGGDVEELRLIRENLEAEKEQLRNDNTLAQKRYNQIRNKVAGYTELLESKDAEIAELKQLNEALYSENTVLKEDQRKLSQTLVQVESDKEELTKKVAQASQLEAQNISVIGLNSRGKGKERDRYRNNQIRAVAGEIQPG